jgi:uncharacterized protein DUF5329
VSGIRRWLLAFLLVVLPLCCAVASTARSPDIDALIARVEQSRGVAFVRNGSAHSAHEAATHLRRKLAAAHGRIVTAEQFIDVLGTRSSLTGIAYRVRFADGREIDSAVWLRQLLRELREARLKAPVQPPRTAPSPSHATR